MVAVTAAAAAAVEALALVLVVGGHFGMGMVFTHCKLGNGETVCGRGSDSINHRRTNFRIVGLAPIVEVLASDQEIDIIDHPGLGMHIYLVTPG